MFTYLIILFTVLPALELAVLIKVGTQIGALNTIMVIIFTGILGATLARIEGFVVLKDIQGSLDRGEMPTESMLDGVMIFCGGVLLLTPGFITDTMGFLMLIPWTRQLIKIWARRKISSSIKSGNTMKFYSSAKTAKPDDFHKDYEDAEFH